MIMKGKSTEQKRDKRNYDYKKDNICFKTNENNYKKQKTNENALFRITEKKFSKSMIYTIHYCHYAHAKSSKNPKIQTEIFQPANKASFNP